MQSDFQILKKYHKFVRDECEDIDPKLGTEQDYGNMIAKKYYDKLYREYAIIEFSQTNQIGMRWRTEKEVLSGKGETICGNKNCSNNKYLSTWEVNFKYKENGENKQTLVKVCCCNECSHKLNTKKQHKKIEDKTYTDRDIQRMLEKLENKKKKIKKEEDS